MTDQEVIAAFDIEWSPATGWRQFPDYGRGASLPPHASSSTLTEATQSHASPRASRDTGSKGTQTRYAPEDRMKMRHLHTACGLPPTVIAKRFGIPLSTVKHILYAK